MKRNKEKRQRQRKKEKERKRQRQREKDRDKELDMCKAWVAQLVRCTVTILLMLCSYRMATLYNVIESFILP
jgi:hypothetical protein